MSALDKYLYPPVVSFDTVNSEKPIVVGIAGGSGSGKTTMTKAVLDCIGIENITFICHDSYYKDLSHLTSEERDARNFDHPDALDTHLLYEHLAQLKRGEEVRIPIYDYKTHTRMEGDVLITAKKVILVEGVLIFADNILVNEVSMPFSTSFIC
jgi:uridine kinase